VRRVAAAGGDVNSYDKHGKQAIHWAAERGDTAMIRTLVELGFKPIDSVTIATETPARQPDTLLCFGETAMHKAAGRGKTQAMRLLMMLDLPDEKLNCQDSEGFTALHKAARRGHVEAVELLIELNFSNMDAKDKKGMTALHRTVDQGSRRCSQVLQVLISSGKCNLNIGDNSGQTPLALAKAKGMTEAVQVLKAAGAK
jgi:ankyrin repeat protein